jgi:hypothetical protein
MFNVWSESSKASTDVLEGPLIFTEARLGFELGSTLGVASTFKNSLLMRGDAFPLCSAAHTFLSEPVGDLWTKALSVCLK